MRKVFQFLADSAKELTGQPSSKRIIAYWGAVLIGVIVIGLVYVMVHAAKYNQPLSAQVVDLVHFIGAVVLVSVIGFVLTILGFNLSQNKAALTAQAKQILPTPEKTDPDATN